MLDWAIQSTTEYVLAVSPWILRTELGIPDSTVAMMVQSSAPRSVWRMTSLVKMRNSIKNPERTPRVMEMVLYESLLSRIGAPQLVAVTFLVSGRSAWSVILDLGGCLCSKVQWYKTAVVWQRASEGGEPNGLERCAARNVRKAFFSVQLTNTQLSTSA